MNYLGEGGYGKVYKVKHKLTGQYRAMKIIKCRSSSKNHEKQISNEIEILKSLDHPNILKVYEFFCNRKTFFIINELCTGGELFDKIIEVKHFSESVAANIMRQIFSAIAFCHSQGVIHRDLKPENILIERQSEKHLEYFHIKIIDFGTCEILKNNKMLKEQIGTSFYIAPDVLKNEYNEKCDLWSCGVIMYILLSGRPPFEGEDEDEILKNVSSGEFDLKNPPFNKISKYAKDLIVKLLNVKVEERISAEEALNHRWFKELKIQDIYNNINDRNVIKKLIENLKKYRRTSILQETALAYLVHNFPQIRDIINSCKLFNQIDKSGDGKITKDELYMGLSQRYKSQTLKSDVEQIYNNLDMDNNGYIGYEEFVRASVSKEYFVKDNVLRYAFRYFDKDGSGEITLDEIKELFSQNISDKNKVDETLRKIIGEVDNNNDGRISFHEFSIIMKKMLY